MLLCPATQVWAMGKWASFQKLEWVMKTQWSTKIAWQWVKKLSTWHGIPAQYGKHNFSRISDHWKKTATKNFAIEAQPNCNRVQALERVSQVADRKSDQPDQYDNLSPNPHGMEKQNGEPEKTLLKSKKCIKKQQWMWQTIRCENKWNLQIMYSNNSLK